MPYNDQPGIPQVIVFVWSMNPCGFGADGGGETIWNILINTGIIFHVSERAWRQIRPKQSGLGCDGAVVRTGHHRAKGKWEVSAFVWDQSFEQVFVLWEHWGPWGLWVDDRGHVRVCWHNDARLRVVHWVGLNSNFV
jgi:hypothetical protein